MTGAQADTKPIVADINERFELGTIACGPGVMPYSRVNIKQLEDMSIVIDGHDKLNTLKWGSNSCMETRCGILSQLSGEKGL